MNTEASKLDEQVSVEIVQKNGEVDIILGHDKHILNGYERDNVKLVGGWYVNNVRRNTAIVREILLEHKIQKVNFVGTSKSCTGAIIITRALMRQLPDVSFKLFLFSAYTSLDKEVYIRRKIDDRVPGSLKSVWESRAYSAELIRVAEARGLVNKDNVQVFLFFPEKSKQGEPVLARRVSGQNIVHVGMPVWMHNTLYPLWKKVENDRTIEIYESEFRKMEPADYEFYSAMQAYPVYSFNLYSCIEDPERFIKNLEAFKANYVPADTVA
jgi:hypothetical protein